MSDAQRGVPRWTDEQKQQMSISRTGKIISQETKDKMSLVKLGKKKTQETRARMSKARRIFSDEQELEIVRLRNSGMSASSLAKLYKCSKFPIYNILKRHN
jgi:Mor family transcriptional regulator